MSATLAQVDRPTENAANLTDRELPSLERAVQLLRIARCTNDRHGIRLFSRLVDRILDASYAAAAPAPETDADIEAEVIELRPPVPAEGLTDWTGADYDSHQVLVSAGATNPTALVAAARRPRTAEDSARGWAA